MGTSRIVTDEEARIWREEMYKELSSFNPINFDKVMKLQGFYQAIGRKGESVSGFGNISFAYSGIIVTKDEECNNQYRINIYIKNEWNRTYTALGDYEYMVNPSGLYMYDEEEDEYNKINYNNPLTPLYYNAGGKFRKILNHLLVKVGSEQRIREMA